MGNCATAPPRRRGYLPVVRSVLSTALALAPFAYGSARRQPFQFGLAVFGVALGVALVVAIDLCSDSARTAHSEAEQVGSGLATHRVVGGPNGVAESVYHALRVVYGARSATPVLGGDVELVDSDGGPEHVSLLGVDPFARATQPSLAETMSGSDQVSLFTLLVEPESVLIGSELAARMSLTVGDSLRVRGVVGDIGLRVAGVIQPADPTLRAWLGMRAIVDVATAQEVLGRLGYLDSIDLTAPPNADQTQWAAELSEKLPDTVSLRSADARVRQARALMQSFDTNLDMLGLLALMVGLLLVYNAMTFVVVVRREQLGVLRALGVTRAAIFGLILAEATVIGVVASAVGVAMGIALASQLLALVAQTLNDLYFQVQIDSLHVRAQTLWSAASLGVVGAICASLVPAGEAARATPASAVRRSSLEEGVGKALPWVAGAGAVLMLLGLGLLALPGERLDVAFASLAALVMGAGAMTPAALRWLCVTLGSAAEVGGYNVATVALRGVAMSASRCSVAVAALTVALGSMAGVGIMIESFRGGVDQWLKSTLRAEFYVYESSSRARSVLPDDFSSLALSHPDVEAISLGRRAEVIGRTGPLNVTALRLPQRARLGFEFLGLGMGADDGPEAALWRDFDAGAVLISEPFARRHALALGESVSVQTEVGWRDLTVAGIYRDYASEQGTMILALDAYRRLFRDSAVSTAGVYLKPAGSRAKVMSYLEARYGSTIALNSTSAAEIHAASLTVFDRTFAITHVLRLITVAVAFTGVLGALLALQLERRRELSLLRALGFTQWQSAASVMAQTGAIGLAAGLFSMPLGLGVGAFLVHVINVRAFGWSLGLDVEPTTLLQALAVALVAALLAGIYPAMRLRGAQPASGLRYE
jgi:putative ABC transport system permease protein